MADHPAFDFYNYQSIFNSGDDEGALELWAEDLRVRMPVGPGRVGVIASSKQEFREFLIEAHRGIREIMRIQRIIQDGDAIFVEFDMDFYALQDRPDFNLGPVSAGEFLTLKMFASYAVREGRLSQVELAFWPVNVAVSDPPTTGPGATPAELAGSVRANLNHSPAGDAGSIDDPEANKSVVREFVQEVAWKRNLDALNHLVAEDYVQHNPHAGQGRAGVREFFAGFHQTLDDDLDPKDITKINLIAEGEFVVHQMLRRNGMLVDIWRVKDGMLREHWDAFRAAEGHPPLAGF